MEQPEPDDKVRFLEEAGAGATAHSRRTLLDHLLGVRDLLAAWKARPALVDAGMFHSVYGTEYYVPQIVDEAERERVRAAIGEEAERIAYLWSRLRRVSIAANVGRQDNFSVTTRGAAEDVEIRIERSELCDFATLWAADTLEQVDRLGGRTRHQPELYSLRHLMPKPAARTLERIFAERPFAKR